MQKIATRVFIVSSITFGVLGSLFWATIPRNDEETSDLNFVLMILLGITASVILSSFAVSVAGKSSRTIEQVSPHASMRRSRNQAKATSLYRYVVKPIGQLYR